MLSILFTLFSRTSGTRDDFLSLRVLLAGLPVRMWLLLAFHLFSFPEPVTLNLFAAPLWVFILGTLYLLPSLRRYDHRDAVAFMPWCMLYVELSGEYLYELIEDLHAELGPDPLPAPEEHGDLGLVSVVQEPPYVPHLEFEVVVVYLGP